MEVENTFYLLEINFWNHWSTNVGFDETKAFKIKKEKLKVIDNQSLIEPGHEYRPKEMLYNEKFIIVPK